MGVFSRFPYNNAHQLNLDLILSELDKMKEEMEDIKDISTITYADPIQWNITTQYATNTVVLDTNGNAYLSKQPVPSGILLTNTDYWQQIGNFGAEVAEVRTLINAETDNRIEADDALGARITALDTKIDEMDLGLVNVKDYGAVGDGVADDTEALQSALDKANGRTIFIPTGVYKTTRTLVYPSNTNILGAGEMNSIIKVDAAVDGMVSQGFYSATGTDTADDVCHNICMDNFTIDGGFYSDLNNYIKSGKTLGRGICFYGTAFQFKNMRIMNFPQTNLWLEFSNAWSVINERGAFYEGLLFNDIISLSGENGLYINKVFDFSIIKCSIHTNGQKNTGSSANYANVDVQRGSFKMVSSHLSSLYGSFKPHVSLLIGAEAGMCNIDNSHIEGAYYPIMIYAPFQNFVDTYFYGSFGDTDIYLASAYNSFINCQCGPQVSDATHTYPTWKGAVTFAEGSTNNNMDLKLFNTKFTTDISNSGQSNTFKLFGTCPEGSKFMDESNFSRSQIYRADWDVSVRGAKAPNKFHLVNRLQNLYSPNISYNVAPRAMTGDIFTGGEGLTIIDSYTAGTIFINFILNAGDEIILVNNTASEIPLNGTGGVYVNGVTYPASSSLTIPANKTTRLIAIDTTHCVVE